MCLLRVIWVHVEIRWFIVFIFPPSGSSSQQVTLNPRTGPLCLSRLINRWSTATWLLRKRDYVPVSVASRPLQQNTPRPLQTPDNKWKPVSFHPIVQETKCVDGETERIAQAVLAKQLESVTLPKCHSGNRFCRINSKVKASTCTFSRPLT